jgi:6-phosphofructokinase 1
VLIKELGDQYFTSKRRNESARAAIFTRKLGHTQRGGRPIHFDRYYAAQLGGHAVDLLVQGRNNSIAVLNWSQRTGFELSEAYANQFRDRYRHIHARKMHPSFYDPVNLRPSALGIAYLEPIFTNAVGIEDVEALRYDLFTTDHLTTPYHSVNTDITKRIRYVAPPSSTDRPNPHGTPG